MATSGSRSSVWSVTTPSSTPLSDFGTDVAPTLPRRTRSVRSPARPAVDPVGPYETVAEGGQSTGGSLATAPGTRHATVAVAGASIPIHRSTPSPRHGHGRRDLHRRASTPPHRRRAGPSGGRRRQRRAVRPARGCGRWPGTTDVEIQFADSTSQPLADRPGWFRGVGRTEGAAGGGVGGDGPERHGGGLRARSGDHASTIWR